MNPAGRTHDTVFVRRPHPPSRIVPRPVVLMFRWLVVAAILGGVLIMNVLGHHDTDGDDAFVAPPLASAALSVAWQATQVELTGSHDGPLSAVIPVDPAGQARNEMPSTTEFHLVALACVIAFVVVSGALAIGRLAERSSRDATSPPNRLNSAGVCIPEMSPARCRVALCVSRI